MSKENRQRFWVCYVDEEDSPKTKHWSELAAREEAARLAILTNKDVFLLEANLFVRIQPPQPPVVWKCTHER